MIIYSLLYNPDRWSKQNEYEGGSEYNISAMHKSNHDVVYDDGSGFFFFRARQSRLFQPTKNLDYGMILRNFSAGLIPLVGLLILVISLRKGWAFLQGQLMH